MGVSALPYRSPLILHLPSAHSPLRLLHGCAAELSGIVWVKSHYGLTGSTAAVPDRLAAMSMSMLEEGPDC